MAISSSSETIRSMEKTLKDTITEIRGIQENIKGAMNSTANWNDAQGQKYRELMKKIAQLTQSPVGTLNEAIPKLEKLAVALDNYGKVKF